MPFNDDEESEKAAFFGQALFQFKKDEVLSRKEQSSANANNNVSQNDDVMNFTEKKKIT